MGGCHGGSLYVLIKAFEVYHLFTFISTGLFRATNVLTHYRGLELPSSRRFKSYLERLISHPDVKKTCSTLELYLDSYERWVFYWLVIFIF